MGCPGRRKGFRPAAGSCQEPVVGKAAFSFQAGWGGERLALAILPYPRGALSPVLPINHLQ